jgi:hypothetical protein
MMDNDIFQGIIRYTKQEIQTRIEQESKKIIGEVIALVMSRLKFEVFKHPQDLRTEICFIFNDKDDE